jgi:hypothetical protein
MVHVGDHYQFDSSSREVGIKPSMWTDRVKRMGISSEGSEELEKKLG